MDLERDAITTLERWRDHPEAFVREEMGVEPDAWQLEALRAFPHNNRLAMKACKGPGKTAILAWLVLNFLATRPNPKIGATSITGDNLATNLWPEISLWMGKSEFCRSTFRWTKTRVEHKAHGSTWFAVARTWPKSGNAEEQANALAGIHGDYCMFVLDESGGIPQAVMVTAEAVLASGIETKVVQAGNPTHTTGPLYVACTSQRHLWYVITITGDPDDPKRSPRIKIEWAREQIASYGRDNPWVMVNVLGQFPPSSINSLLGVEEVEAAMKRAPREDAYTWAQKRLGVDVARFGDDRTVIFPRQGLMSWKPVIMRNARTTDIAARVMLAENRFGQGGEVLTFVDDTGHWGHGVIDNLIAAGRTPIPLNYAGKAIDPRYKNRRVEFWLKGAEAVRAGAALPYIPEMIPELTEPTYTFVNGVFVLEEKDQIKARIGKSPDLADAYMQTYALEEMPGEVLERIRGRQSARHDADPYIIESSGNAARDFDPFR